MNEHFIADDIEVAQIISSMTFNNPSYVQLFHRLLAYFIVVYVLVIYFNFFRSANLVFPFKFIFLALGFQVVLGILTLVSGLNMYLASLHQMGSILLISSAIYGLFYVNQNQNLIDTLGDKQ